MLWSRMCSCHFSCLQRLQAYILTHLCRTRWEPSTREKALTYLGFLSFIGPTLFVSFLPSYGRLGAYVSRQRTFSRWLHGVGKPSMAMGVLDAHYPGSPSYLRRRIHLMSLCRNIDRDLHTSNHFHAEGNVQASRILYERCPV